MHAVSVTTSVFYKRHTETLRARQTICYVCNKLARVTLGDADSNNKKHTATRILRCKAKSIVRGRGPIPRMRKEMLCTQSSQCCKNPPSLPFRF